MAVAQAFGNAEIIQIADAVAREKHIDREAVLDAMEQAIQIAGRRKYGAEQNIKAEISRKTGEIQLYRVTDIVDVMPELEEEQIGKMLEADAKRINATLKAGDTIRDPLPPIDFGRIAAQTAKQVIVQRVRDAERERHFDEYKDRVGEIINGVIKRVEYGNITVDLGQAEGFIRRNELIPRENFRQGDRIRAYIYDVRRERTGPQIFLSRVRPEFTAKLFAQEVPEIYDGIIEIKAVARDPGSRAKIAVYSHDSSVNPVLSCVGVRGSRVQAVVGELQGEKIDIIEWNPDEATFIVNAISSAEVTKVVLDEDNGRVEIVVPDDQLSLAIGRRGQNVRLASQLTGWSIDILTEETESERRSQEFNKLSNMFITALNVEEVIAHLLVTEGFATIEEVAFVPIEEMATIEGFDEEVAQELRNRANDWIDSQDKEFRTKTKELGITDDLATLQGLDNKLIIALGEQSIKTRDDLADLSIDEFKELLPESGLKDAEINELIMAARAHWFEGEEAAETAKPDQGAV
ncbi:MAG: transcription termination factor NusA [Rickettsiales bacterium]|nr:transcription termination factor NusA [Rickettsiales bacterium]